MLKTLFNIGSFLGYLIIIYVLGSALVEAGKALLLRNSHMVIAERYKPLSESERERLYYYSLLGFYRSHCEYRQSSEWFV